MADPVLIDLYCGAGGSGVGYKRAGFDVIGVDNVKQPRYPFPMWTGDAIQFLDYLIQTRGLWPNLRAIHASPPCQAFSGAQRIRDRAHPDLIGPTRERLEEIGLPYVIENVPGAPLHDPIMLCGTMFPPMRTYRHRLFEANFELSAPPHGKHVHKQAKMGRAPKDGEWIQVVGHFSGVPYARKAMGIDWMVRNELKEAIPPAYTEYVGRELMKEVERRERLSQEAPAA